jgi:hypothetical protein
VLRLKRQKRNDGVAEDIVEAIGMLENKRFSIVLVQIITLWLHAR